MTNSFRLSMGALSLAALAACSSQSAPPALSDDLKQDLAKVGGGDVQLAGASSARRLDVVSAAERTPGNVPSPRSPSLMRAPSAHLGTRAVVRRARHVTPAPAPAREPVNEVAPVETPQRAEPLPEPERSQERPHQAPMPSTQREPRGGWKTPGEIIRNAPFPINP